MLSENIIVNVLHQGLHVIVICGFKLLPDRVLFHLDVIVVVVGVAEHVTHDFNRLCHIIFEGKSVINSVLS